MYDTMGYEATQYDVLRLVAPVVQHTYREALSGVPVEHALWQAAMGGLLIGAGYSPRSAIRTVERLERAYLVPGAITEPLRFQYAEERGVMPDLYGLMDP